MVCVFCVCVVSHSVMLDPVRPHGLWGPPDFSVMEFSWQEYWSEFPFLTLGDLPDPGIEPLSLASPALAGRFFTTGNPLCVFYHK